MEDAARVKEEAHGYIENLFNGQNWQRPTLAGVEFKQISEAEMNMLNADFSTDEILATVQN